MGEVVTLRLLTIVRPLLSLTNLMNLEDASLTSRYTNLPPLHGQSMGYDLEEDIMRPQLSLQPHKTKCRSAGKINFFACVD